MVYKIIVVFFFLCSGLKLAAQDQQGESFMDRVTFGGGFGAWISDNYSFVELSPAAAYRVSPRLTAGLGITYMFIDQRYYYQNGDSFKESTHSYGGRLFSRMSLFGPIFAHGEYEALSYEFPTTGGEFIREWVPGLFLGGGFMQPVGRKGNVGITILYNFQYDTQRSPYNSEWIYRLTFFI